MKIQTMGLFATPKSSEEIMQWIERLNGTEKTAAMTVFGMTWNYLAEAVNKDDEENVSE